MLLTADLHLDDKECNDYRWKIFDHLRAHGEGEVFILGDLCDRADRHSSILVNRLISVLTGLTDAGNEVTILCGNHDLPQKGPAYWNFLNRLPNVHFITKPTAEGKLLLLPYSHNPAEEWKGIPFELYQCVMMHQPINGAGIGHGRTIESLPSLDFPENLPVYSGDIHYCQTIGNVTYIGAPHPVKFGDSHRCRLLVLGEDYHIKREITLRRLRKQVIEVSSLEQLQAIHSAPGDQARVRFTLSADRMEQWPLEQAAITEWAREHGIHLASIEAIIETTPERRVQQFDFDADPVSILEAYCRTEGVGEQLLLSGLQFLNHVNKDTSNG